MTIYILFEILELQIAVPLHLLSEVDDEILFNLFYKKCYMFLIILRFLPGWHVVTSFGLFDLC
jgi:hypothetical protein